MITETVVHLKDETFHAEVHSHNGIVSKVRVPSMNRDITKKVLSNLFATREVYKDVYQEEPVTAAEGM